MLVLLLLQFLHYNAFLCINKIMKDLMALNQPTFLTWRLQTLKMYRIEH